MRDSLSPKGLIISLNHPKIQMAQLGKAISVLPMPQLGVIKSFILQVLAITWMSSASNKWCQIIWYMKLYLQTYVSNQKRSLKCTTGTILLVLYRVSSPILFLYIIYIDTFNIKYIHIIHILYMYMYSYTHSSRVNFN